MAAAWRWLLLLTVAALLAAVFAFVPVLGIFLTAVPAVLLALTVSPATAFAVLAFILLYNAFENDFIAPKVYGRQLRLSDLAVIAAFAVGAELGGVVGALLALPFAAMYPAIEKYGWRCDWAMMWCRTTAASSGLRTTEPRTSPAPSRDARAGTAPQRC